MSHVVQLDRQTAEILSGVMMVVSERPEDELRLRLGMSGPDLDELAERIELARLPGQAGLRVRLSEKELHAVGASFDACFDLQADAMTTSMTGRCMEELRAAQGAVAAALALADAAE